MEGVYLAGGRRTTQLMRDSLGAGNDMVSRTLLCVLSVLPLGAAAQSQAVLPPLVWVVGATEGPMFCLVLEKTGNGRFVAESATFTPVRWRYDTTTGVMSVTYSGLDSSQAAYFRNEAKYHVLAFDSLTNTARYSLRADSTLWYVGYTLFPLEVSDSEERAIAVRKCHLGER